MDINFCAIRIAQVSMKTVVSNSTFESLNKSVHLVSYNIINRATYMIICLHASIFSHNTGQF